MHRVSQDVDPNVARLIDEVAEGARASAAFASVQVEPARVACQCKNQPEAWYRIEFGADGVFASWVSPDRYLSQSIEAELMWTGDDLEELLDEERIDQGFDRGAFGKLEHHRNEEKLFTFRSRLPVTVEDDDASSLAPDLVKCLLAFEAAFRELGDMKPEAD